MKPGSSFGEMPLLPCSPDDVDLHEDPRLVSVVSHQLRERGIGRDGVDVADMRDDRRNLAALERADEVPGEYARVRLALGGEILGPVLPKEGQAGVSELAEQWQRHILDRRENLNFPAPATRLDLTADAIEVHRDDLGPQIGDQFNHATPACRPVRPASRR